MKSRTSSFNVTVFKKDITRFAPAWAIYLIILLLVLAMAMNDGEVYYRLNNMAGFVVVMGWINLFYGALVAQLLFGDLYNSRLCNALHAMPVTRDSWFVTHTAAGLVFSLIPNLILAVLAIPVLRLGAGWMAIPMWLLAASLQYVFFFGTAVFCVMLSGNRLGQIALYAMVQFASMMVYWLVSQIYEPLLHGIQINGEPFYLFSPVAELSQRNEIFIIDYERIVDQAGVFSHYEVYGVTPNEGWGYMALIALVGVGALVAALALYRQRKLECAGDFIAFQETKPVVLVLVTISVGVFCHLFSDAFGLGIQYVMMAAGTLVGYFGCLMLLERNTKIFRKKTFLGFAALLLVFALSMGLTCLDPLGITRYQPEQEEVASITVSDSYSIHHHGDVFFQVTDPADIETILSVHRDCIDRSATEIEGWPEDAAQVSTHLEYKLKNGKSIHRIYYILPNTEAGQALERYYNLPECVLGYPEERLAELADAVFSFYTDGKDSNIHDLEGLDLKGLLDAIVADCKAGNMAQITAYHGYSVYDENFDPYITSVELGWDRENLDGIIGSKEAYGLIDYQYVRVFSSCTNTLRWLEENGMITEAMMRDLGEKYGDEYITFNEG